MLGIGGLLGFGGSVVGLVFYRGLLFFFFFVVLMVREGGVDGLGFFFFFDKLCWGFGSS